MSHEIRAPDGGRLILVRVPVDPGRPWLEAIAAADPDPSTLKYSKIRKVGHKYPPARSNPAEREIILVNFGKKIASIRSAYDWAESQNLKPEQPRGIFAIAEHRPDIYREINAHPRIGAAIVSPQECTFWFSQRVCIVWCYATWRHAELYVAYGEGWRPWSWFAFVHQGD